MSEMRRMFRNVSRIHELHPADKFVTINQQSVEHITHLESNSTWEWYAILSSLTRGLQEKKFADVMIGDVRFYDSRGRCYVQLRTAGALDSKRSPLVIFSVILMGLGHVYDTTAAWERGQPSDIVKIWFVEWDFSRLSVWLIATTLHLVFVIGMSVAVLARGAGRILGAPSKQCYRMGFESLDRWLRPSWVWVIPCLIRNYRCQSLGTALSTGWEGLRMFIFGEFGGVTQFALNVGVNGKSADSASGLMRTN
ncbi:uncharacterized protein F5147DRAFT_764693 [Suillus discolor]|uniref:Uncharacterized protein n=1 Tax=Suillus discolor TaxID=1912936 RepID=A0A9P7ET44_9AGAM|nr:uncharacterized protein F5147DRAFT_764693 [Suillus discolor]KAG2088684.1 hypothetical protein F5147DRAFT_764693 [Suillus discolor]